MRLTSVRFLGVLHTQIMIGPYSHVKPNFHDNFRKKYIEGQAAHHKKEDFRSELLRMLRAHGVEFDERYVFD